MKRTENILEKQQCVTCGVTVMVYDHNHSNDLHLCCEITIRKKGEHYALRH
jgi:hypothetical protein